MPLKLEVMFGNFKKSKATNCNIDISKIFNFLKIDQSNIIYAAEYDFTTFNKFL